MIHIECLSVGPFQSNCYVVSCTDTSEAIVVDAGDDADRIIAATDGLTVKAIVNTHAHLDHVGALPAVREALQVPVLMHPAEKPIYEIVEQQAAMFGLPSPGRVDIDRWLADGDVVEFGLVKADVMLTPGHSPGGICLHFREERPPQIIVGDVLFMGAIGRTDLPGSSRDDMVDTLKNKMATLPEETAVHPGHGPSTTIGRENMTNPFLNGGWDHI